MNLPVWTLLALTLAGADTNPLRPKDAARLTTLVAEIRSADYRGERAELNRLAVALDAIRDPRLAAYRAYWQGFAKWRRVLNGFFNETPMPTDLKDDLLAALSSFKSALVARPDWIEAKVGIVGCSGSLIFLAGQDKVERDKILEEYVPVVKDLMANGNENPRALWLIGGMQLQAPPPTGGDPVKAASTMQKGLEAARREALDKAAAPAYEPTWGGAENLMNLAYLYSQGNAQNRALAMAYAEGALVAVPDWHYVRDVLLAQIRALPEPGR